MEILLVRHGKTQGNLEGRYVGRTDEPLLASSADELREGIAQELAGIGFEPDVIFVSPMLRCRQTAEILFSLGNDLCGNDLRETDLRGNDLCGTDLCGTDLRGTDLRGTDLRGNDLCETDLCGKAPARQTGSEEADRYLMFGGARVIICPGLRETDFGEFEYKNYEELNGHPAYQAWIDSGGMLAFPKGESGAEFRSRCRAAYLDCLQQAREIDAKRVAFVVHGGTIMSIMENYGLPKADFYSWQVKNGRGFLGTLKTDGTCECRTPMGENGSAGVSMSKTGSESEWMGGSLTDVRRLG